MLPASPEPMMPSDGFIEREKRRIIDLKQRATVITDPDEIQAIRTELVAMRRQVIARDRALRKLGTTP